MVRAAVGAILALGGGATSTRGSRRCRHVWRVSISETGGAKVHPIQAGGSRGRGRWGRRRQRVVVRRVRVVAVRRVRMVAVPVPTESKGLQSRAELSQLKEEHTVDLFLHTPAHATAYREQNDGGAPTASARARALPRWRRRPGARLSRATSKSKLYLFSLVNLNRRDAVRPSKRLTQTLTS